MTGLVSLLDGNVKAFLNLNDFNLLQSCIGPRDISDISEGALLLNEIDIKALPTPGHTQGSTCFYSEKESLLISGDTVFADGYFGRTDLIGGSDSDMKASLRYLSTLRVEALLPGHGNYTLDGGSRAISMALSNANYLL